MTETLLSALRMGFDVSIKYRDVEDCYIVKVSRNNCYYNAVETVRVKFSAHPRYTIEEIINVCIRYGMESVLQQEEVKTDE